MIVFTSSGLNEEVGSFPAAFPDGVAARPLEPALAVDDGARGGVPFATGAAVVGAGLDLPAIARGGDARLPAVPVVGVEPAATAEADGDGGGSFFAAAYEGGITGPPVGVGRRPTEGAAAATAVDLLVAAAGDGPRAVGDEDVAGFGETCAPVGVPLKAGGVLAVDEVVGGVLPLLLLAGPGGRGLGREVEGVGSLDPVGAPGGTFDIDTHNKNLSLFVDPCSD